jgi:imidazolonepropionase-like amidohydrolase
MNRSIMTRVNAQDRPRRHFIAGARLLDGRSQPTAKPHSVLVEDDRIAAVGPASELHCPKDVEAIDARGLTLMPGMIDCHDHLASIPGSMRERSQIPPSLAVIKAAAALEDTLLAGFTGIRDAGGLDQGLKFAVEQGLIAGPKLKISINILGQTGGQNSHVEPSGVDSQFPILPGVPDAICDGVDACRQRTRAMILAGADWIKLATTGGMSPPVGEPLLRQLSADEIAAIVDTAHAAGKPVMCHAYGGEGARLAIAHGVQSIEHGAALEREDLEIMERKGVWLIPTFAVLVQVAEIAGRDPFAVPAHVARKANDLLARLQVSFALAREIGVKIALGTDAGGIAHGRNAREFGYMVDAGMKPLAAITAGTADAALCMGLGDETGVIAKGRSADLLLVDGDPLADIRILEDRARLRLIMKDGKIYKGDVDGRFSTAKGRPEAFAVSTGISIP